LTHWLGVVLSALIGVVNLYVGYVRAETGILVVGVTFLLGVVLYVSRFWHPVLYLLGALHAGVLVVLWLLSGFRYLELGIVNGVLCVALASIAVYLFVVETSVPAAE
jgi:hypothetical protein